MTLAEYWNQEDPSKTVDVVLAPSDFTIIDSDSDPDYTLIKIQGIPNYLYWVEVCSKDIFTSDDLGFPQSLTCFRIA